MKKTAFLGFLTTFLPVLAAADPIGIKTAHEIYFGLASATGISANDPQVAAFFAGVLGRLPKDGKVDEAGSPMQFAHLNLAGAFCHRFVTIELEEANPERRLAHRYVDLIGGIKGFTPAVARATADGYFRIFLGRDATAAEIEATVAASRDYVPAAGAKANLPELLGVLCSAVAGSPEFLFF